MHVREIKRRTLILAHKLSIEHLKREGKNVSSFSKKNQNKTLGQDYTYEIRTLLKEIKNTEYNWILEREEV